MRPQHRALHTLGDLVVHGERQLDVLRDTREPVVKPSRIQRHRRQRRCRRYDRVPERSGNLQSRSIAARLWQRESTGCQGNHRRQHPVAESVQPKWPVFSRDRYDTGSGTDPHVQRLRGMHQSLEDVTRPVADGKEFAGRLLLQRHTQFGEKLDRLRNGQPAEDPADDRAFTTPVIPFGDDLVRDVTAGTATDEDLGARFCRAVEQVHPRPRLDPLQKDGRGKAGSAGAHDGDVSEVRGGQGRWLTAASMSAWTRKAIGSAATIVIAAIISPPTPAESIRAGRPSDAGPRRRWTRSS